MAFLYLPETLEDKRSLWNDFCRWLKYQFDREASPSDYQCTQTTFADGPCARPFVDDPHPTKRDYIRIALIVFLQAGHLAGSDKLMPDLLADHGWAPGHIGDLLGLGVFVQAVALLIAQFCGGLTRETYYRVTAMYPSLYICIYLAKLLPPHVWVCAAKTLNVLRALAQSVVIPSLSQIVADLATDSPRRGRTTGRLNATAYAARLVALMTYGPLQDFGRGLGFAYLPWCFNAIVASVNACVLLSSSAFFNAKSHRFK
ncbi:hypothetical protein KC318_g253 [Hortaea werneckii]|nr:hypothetical protein KC318_g253 [Hortaea werneckii]